MGPFTTAATNQEQPVTCKAAPLLRPGKGSHCSVVPARPCLLSSGRPQLEHRSVQVIYTTSFKCSLAGPDQYTHRKLYLHSVLLRQLKARHTVLTLVLSDRNVLASLWAINCCSSGAVLTSSTFLNAAMVRPRCLPPCGPHTPHAYGKDRHRTLTDSSRDALFGPRRLDATLRVSLCYQGYCLSICSLGQR